MDDIYPPIADRTTEALIEMIETSGKWRDDVIKAASKELALRGIPFEAQARKYKMRKQRETNYKKRTDKIKAKATYSTNEKVLIFFLGPFLSFILLDPTLFQSGPGYKNKNRQGLFYLLLGIAFWCLVAIIYTELSS